MLIDDSVQFEQRQFQPRVGQGLYYYEARERFKRRVGYWTVDHRGETLRVEESDGVFNLADALVDVVQDLDEEVPVTFALDRERIEELRQDLKRHQHHEYLPETVTELFEQRYRQPPAPPMEMRRIVDRVEQLFQADDAESPSVANIALEILRAAPRPADSEEGQTGAIPDERDVDWLANQLRTRLNAKAALYDQLHDGLRNQVAQEVIAVAAKTPLQIHTHYAPTWAARGEAQDVTLESIAKRIAHISVIHWRVWAPILYQQPMKPFEERGCRLSGRGYGDDIDYLL